MSLKRRLFAAAVSTSPVSSKRTAGQERTMKPTTVSSSASVDGLVEPIFPEVWEEIPQLLFVDMQKDNVHQVGDAVDSLTMLMSESDQHSDQNARDAVRLGAPAVVMLVMRKFQYNEDLQGCGCSCLQMLAFHPSNRKRLAKCGILEVIVSALRIFPDSRFVQDSGWAALQNLFGEFNTAPALQQAADRFVFQLDGIELAVRAMKKFADEAELQANCSGLFWALVEGKKEFQEEILSAGALDIIKAATLVHPDHEGVHETTTAFMKSIAHKVG